jgi:deazaflavin-dependent oxidoreductase (nitroreductase family)
MNEQLSNALAFGHTIDITTTGRRTGLPRRIEIVFHRIDGRLIVSGSPRVRRRAWLRNLEADPRLTFHLKGQVVADLPGTARIITDEADRRAIADWLVTHAWPTMDAAAMARYSPMIEITLEELAA